MPPFTRHTIKTFMEANVVRCPTTDLEQVNIPYVAGEPGVVWAYLRNLCAPTSVPRCTLEGGGGNVYKLEFLTEALGQQNNDAFKTYWVPYKSDDVGTLTVLGNDANFMFSARMTGCSFGIGSHAGDGVVACAHVNSMSSGTAINKESQENQLEQQKKVQRAFLYSHRKTGPNTFDESRNLTKRIISFDMYMYDNGNFDTSLSMTPFGVHATGGPWTFYSQRYRGIGLNVRHAGVIKQVSGVF
jgi:hypothetical protein